MFYQEYAQNWLANIYTEDTSVEIHSEYLKGIGKNAVTEMFERISKSDINDYFVMRINVQAKQ